MSIPGILRFLSIVLTAIVSISFISFVWDEAGAASKNQLAISRPDGTAAPYTRDQHGRMIGLHHSKIRLKNDSVADTITSPGESIGRSASENEWVLRGAAFLFGFLIFFLGLRWLANWIEISTRPAPPPERQPDEDYTPGYR